MHIGIVADDLTGAADSLAPFARLGFYANVGFELKHTTERFPLNTGEALAYDTATRDLPREQVHIIQRTVRRAAHRLASLDPQIVFKKLDSTLRGHLRVELEALRAEFPNRMALICSAFPAQGRTVQSGVLHINNVPWTATEFAPAGMFASLTVRDLFGIGQAHESAEIGIGTIREGAEHLEAQLDRLYRQGVTMVFCDALQQSDLFVLAQTILKNPQRYLPVGSAGLARALADASPAPSTPATSLEELVRPFVNGRVIVVVGSMHAASRRQRDLLATRLEAAPVVLEDREEFKTCVTRSFDAVRMQITGGSQVVLLTTPDTPEPGHADNFALLAGSVVWRIGYWAESAGLTLEGIVVCGGDTARELCRACNGTGLQIEGEWQPGVAIGRLRAERDVINNFSFDGLPVITKAGGFGDDQTLARSVGLL